MALTEGRHSAEFIMSEASGSRSRDTITVASGAALVAGTVVGKITIGAATAAEKSGGNAANTGAITMDATTPVLVGAKVGVYTVRCITAASNSGTFRVTDPDGFVLGDVAVAATFANDIKFSIADGSQDFIVGEGFDVTVAAGSGKYVAAPDTSYNGSHVATGIVIYATESASADVKVAAIVRSAEVNGNILTYASSVDDADKKAVKVAQLAALGILVR